jgi:hypothetical protein
MQEKDKQNIEEQETEDFKISDDTEERERTISRSKGSFTLDKAIM